MPPFRRWTNGGAKDRAAAPDRGVDDHIFGDAVTVQEQFTRKRKELFEHQGQLDTQRDGLIENSKINCTNRLRISPPSR